MNIAAVVLWSLVILLTFAVVPLAIVATRPGRHRLVILCVLPVAGILAVGLFGEIVAPHPAFSVALGFGIALLGVIAGSPVVSLLLRTATRDSVMLGAHGGILVRDANAPPPAQREVLRGGITIGYLERFALIGSVLAGQAAAVAVIVAVKGLGRFSELENEQARERFIIGTLASLIWAGVCAAAAMTLV
ncbi:MAG: hypothetical protein JWL94_1329 [Microbacteriaceae bacterium]|nr:hypothetical protein [Microbacteriaceae bacterium]